ncbi:MAG: aminopeptidase [Candidatus Portnoybacteria bacterium CG09_land_8_20_14_0_10_44_13]|uniref:Aminopeptidase n=4 Tax=Candidatus Portnoyibacteriota TaxID=1817913 RepID=A0A2H0KPS3_9BACT|nr:MAG: aminopeptidase [Parcubacteria group bacterium CG2_30_44_18]PIQ74117.1 MAG: aminopeptidase [Candidatus Portnoybacteria bacterium CG11_big_fil_rev_8_21_14_0_20_44_10]PIS16722.1 MAG: aminopeptidase [Candidatus Portnoybacteria bacterium CG09_land_8_20_14_0_10_44_13]PIZ68770.1 MAG: aminopeptidase [Candidatus Portnoybacteria bacterium CG_4_10_14_0_2_um_filter_44_20]
MDPRVRQLAKNLIGYSVGLKPGEKVLIRAANAGAFPLAEALVEAAYEAGGLPFCELADVRIVRALMMRVTAEQLELEEKLGLEKIKEMQAFIGFTAPENQFETIGIPSENMRRASKIGKPSLDHRVKHTKWCILRYPTPAMAQAAEMSSEAFEDFFYNVCLLDYAKMSRAMDSLVALMNKTDKVHICGQRTNLTFSIKGIPAIKCDGRYNVPDGEIFAAPVRDSVNGSIYFTAPTIYESKRFGGIHLHFLNGQIQKVTCEQGTEKELNEILDRDEGARYVGEFAIGVNPLINKPMLNILFDEKIAGSFHFTPGQCYDDAPNGNDSQIHWDMVCIQTPEYGGGEIYFDERLVRKDGRFVLPELEVLNPENLL